MGWLESAVGALQSGYVPGSDGGGAFPAALPQTDEEKARAIWEQIQAEEAANNAAADRRNVAGMTRAPITNVGNPLSAISEPSVSLALNGGVQSPQNAAAPFGAIPPSLAMAKTEAKSTEQPSGPVPMPQPRPAAADAPTDVSSQARPVGPPMQLAAPMGLVPPQQAQQPQPQAPGPSIGERIQGFAPALLAAGAALQGDNSVAQNMLKQREALALQAQQGNATARLLASKGASPAEVQAAMTAGPEAIKALLGQYLGKDKFQVVQTREIEDQYGGKKKVFQIFDANTGQLKDIPAKSATDAQAAASGEDGVPGLNEAQKNRVQAIIDGREPYPAQSRARDAQMIRDAVHAADPQFDAVNYNARLKARQSFTSGKDRDNLKSFNTTIGHLEELDKAVGDLHNSSFPAWNKYIANPVAEQFDPKYQTALKRFQAARTAVSDELTRAFRGSGGNVHDIIQWENAINAADSPEALRSAIRTAANLLESRISSVGDSYNSAMGTTKDPLELLTPHAREAFEQLKAGARGKSGGEAAPVKPGAYVWDPVKGLVPK